MEAVAIKAGSDSEQDFDDMPFMPKKKTKRLNPQPEDMQVPQERENPSKTSSMISQPIVQTSSQQNQVIADPAHNKDKDWLLDPVNLYMRGMAQRRE